MNADRKRNSRANLQRLQKRSTLLIALVFLLVSCSMGSFIGASLWNEPGIRRAPLAMHSVLQANYSADPRQARRPVVQIELIQDALQDQPDASLDKRFSDVKNSLQTPVATVTPLPGLQLPTSTPTNHPPTQIPQSATPSPTQRESIRPTAERFTSTPDFLRPTLTLYPTRTPTSTASRPAIRQDTATPTATPMPTRPPATATSAPQPTATRPPTQAPTATRPPPTQDPYPPPPEPTDTPAPEPTDPPYP